MVSSRIATALQIVALLIALLGVVWDTLAALWVAFPGGSGEWTALAVPAAYVVGVPCGLVGLLILWSTGHSHSRLRNPARLAAVLAIAIPVMMSLVLRRR